MANKETKGADVGLYVDIAGTQTLVAAKRGLEFEESSDTIDAGHNDNLGWPTRLPGQQDATIDWDGVMLLDDQTGAFAASHNALRQAKRNGDVVTCQIRYPYGNLADQGDFLIETITLTAPYDAEATISVSLSVTGAVSEVTVT